MAISVHVASLTRSRSGKMTGVVVIQPSALTSFRVNVVFDDLGSDENNLHHIQGVLQAFSADFSDALKRPLKIAQKPAAKA
jgi:hypothetical protein